MEGDKKDPLSGIKTLAEQAKNAPKMRLEEQQRQAEQMQQIETIAVLNNETAKMRLELAHLLIKNPHIIPAMTQAGTAQQEPTIQAEGIEKEQQI